MCIGATGAGSAVQTPLLPPSLFEKPANQQDTGGEFVVVLSFNYTLAFNNLFFNFLFKPVSVLVPIPVVLVSDQISSVM